MEVQEEAMGYSKEYMMTQIMKGKRTKRPRQSSPLALTMASTSSSTTEGGGGGAATTSPSNSGELTCSTEEEEDMAKCLILLARGQSGGKSVVASDFVHPPERYQCKTCDRSFPSFQALGGHRASHKKPKAGAEEKKAVAAVNEDGSEYDHEFNTTVLSLQMPTRALASNIAKSKVHECSICGAEFGSGQALGGHMRRHRPVAMVAASSNATPESCEAAGKKSRNVLSLDLNLPAPEDDHRESKFGFASKQQVIVFSASPLVDCHY